MQSDLSIMDPVAMCQKEGRLFTTRLLHIWIRNMEDLMAWCADFVSWCACNAGQSDAIPWNASVSGLRSAIKDAGGKEYSKSEVKDGAYVPVKGDIIIFKSNGASHVGIVDYTSDGRIYYIDGNNTTYGNGNNSSVHYSDCSVSKKTFTCVLKPNYR